MNSNEILAKEALAMAERELNARDYAHYPKEYATIIRDLALAYQEQAAELKDCRGMAERLNALLPHNTRGIMVNGGKWSMEGAQV